MNGRWAIWFLAACLLTSWQNDRQFKAFFVEGKQLYEEGQYAAAAEKLKEALRLNGKPQRIKTEGTFFEPYQPRYWIARCFEHIDIELAAQWMAQSRQAGEADVDKNRQVVADYNAASERIRKAADFARNQRLAKVKLQLDEADRLVDQHRFDEAMAVYQRVYDADPDNADAYAGLQRVAVSRDAFLESKGLETRIAIAESRFDDAHHKLDEIRRIDANFPKLKELETQLSESESEANRVAIATNDKTPEPLTQPVEQQVRTKDPQPIAEKSKLADTAAAKTGNAVAIRRALIDTIGPYRQGNPQAALKILSEIQLTGLDDFGSYHWLKGVYLLSTYYQQYDRDPALLKQAESALVRALELEPDFRPDPQVYPPFIIRHAEKLRAADSQP